MHVTPERLPASEIAKLKEYTCPLSKTSSLEKGTENEWVQCPMVNKPIYLGACIDFQAMASDEDFARHPFIADFYSLEKRVNTTVTVLRRVCLEHQEEILVDLLEYRYENKPEIEKELAWIRKIMTSIEVADRV